MRFAIYVIGLLAVLEFHAFAQPQMGDNYLDETELSNHVEFSCVDFLSGFVPNNPFLKATKVLPILPGHTLFMPLADKFTREGLLLEVRERLHNRPGAPMALVILVEGLTHFPGDGKRFELEMRRYGLEVEITPTTEKKRALQQSSSQQGSGTHSNEPSAYFARIVGTPRKLLDVINHPAVSAVYYSLK